MRDYSIYACTVTIQIVVSFTILEFVYKYDFPPFMILIIMLWNGRTIMALLVDRVLPPDSWDLAEIFLFAVTYGLYLTLSKCVVFVPPFPSYWSIFLISSIPLVLIIKETTFFQCTFSITLDTDFPAIPSCTWLYTSKLPSSLKL